MSFVCVTCETEVFSFVPEGGPPLDWRYDAETDKWRCGMCEDEREGEVGEQDLPGERFE